MVGTCSSHNTLYILAVGAYPPALHMSHTELALSLVPRPMCAFHFSAAMRREPGDEAREPGNEANLHLLAAILCGEEDVLVGEAKRAGRLDEDPGALGLLRVVEEGVLVVVQPSDDRNDQQHEDDGSPVHPVDEDQNQDGGSADPPELPQQEGEETTQRLRRAKPHVPVRRQHGRRHGN